MCSSRLQNRRVLHYSRIHHTSKKHVKCECANRHVGPAAGEGTESRSPPRPNGHKGSRSTARAFAASLRAVCGQMAVAAADAASHLLFWRGLAGGRRSSCRSVLGLRARPAAHCGAAGVARIAARAAAPRWRGRAWPGAQGGSRHPRLQELCRSQARGGLSKN